MTNEKASELLPCPNPWCKLTDPPFVHGGTVRPGADCRCVSCDIHGPWMPTKAEAITAWNTRPSLPDEAELVGVVAKAMIDVGVPSGFTFSYKKWAAGIITALLPFLSDGKDKARNAELEANIRWYKELAEKTAQALKSEDT